MNLKQNSIMRRGRDSGPCSGKGETRYEKSRYGPIVHCHCGQYDSYGCFELLSPDKIRKREMCIRDRLSSAEVFGQPGTSDFNG